jgi:hypothetical protein
MLEYNGKVVFLIPNHNFELLLTQIFCHVGDTGGPGIGRTMGSPVGIV